MKPPSHWNYRVTREYIESEVESGYVYAIRELYYAGDATKPYAWSADPRPITGESVEHIALDLVRMTEIVEHPVWDITARKWVEQKETA